MRRAVPLIGSALLALSVGVAVKGSTYAVETCSATVSNGAYSLRACISLNRPAARGNLYLTLGTDTAGCIVRAHYSYVDLPPSPDSTSWPCPAGPVTDYRLDLPYGSVSAGGVQTKAHIARAIGTIAVRAQSEFVNTWWT